MKAFSNRIPARFEHNRVGDIIRQFESSGRTYIDLVASNPTQIGIDWPSGWWTPIAAEVQQHYVPCPNGSLAARQAIVRDYSARGWHIECDDLFLCASTSEAYTWLFKILADPGGEVLVPSPGYPLLEHLATLEGLRTVAYPLQLNCQAEWRINVDALEALATDACQALLLVSPNNPTGSIVSADEWMALCALSARLELPLILDEVFAGFEAPGGRDHYLALGAALTEIPEARVFVLNGLSKRAALPQAKLAWILCAGDHNGRLRTRAALEWVADTFLSVGNWPQACAQRWLSSSGAVRKQINERIIENEDWLVGKVRDDTRWKPMKREGGWHCIIEHEHQIDDEVLAAEILEKHSVLLHPGRWYGMRRDGYLVASLTVPHETWCLGWERIVTADFV